MKHTETRWQRERRQAANTEALGYSILTIIAIEVVIAWAITLVTL